MMAGPEAYVVQPDGASILVAHSPAPALPGYSDSLYANLRLLETLSKFLNEIPITSSQSPTAQVRLKTDKVTDAGKRLIGHPPILYLVCSRKAIIERPCKVSLD
jgi:hypothetical protein